ncbi:MAG: hypothetical protein ACR2RB_12040 [Gammaproteobacteria bacterium]
MVIDGVANAVDHFITATLSNLEAGTLARDEETRTNAHLFVCGAIMYLADYDEVDKASTDELVVVKLKEHFDLDTAGANAVIAMLDRVSPKDARHIFLIEGASALRRWIADADKSASVKLKELTN